jgi:2-oxoglutarate dehydrogenase E1 component
MEDARSTRYASDLAKGFDIPIIHVNGDDPEACLSAVRLSMAYRDRFHQDVLIDLVGYRRHGHNEGDEPAYTQPIMYERIKAPHPGAELQALVRRAATAEQRAATRRVRAAAEISKPRRAPRPRHAASNRRSWRRRRWFQCRRGVAPTNSC